MEGDDKGMPQGSLFGPTLWNLFQNDMIYNVNNTDLMMYADDHQLYKSGTDYCEVKDSLEKEGQRAVIWCKDNFLLANPDKFQALTINLPQPEHHLPES